MLSRPGAFFAAPWAQFLPVGAKRQPAVEVDLRPCASGAWRVCLAKRPFETEDTRGTINSAAECTVCLKSSQACPNVNLMTPPPFLAYNHFAVVAVGTVRVDRWLCSQRGHLARSDDGNWVPVGRAKALVLNQATDQLKIVTGVGEHMQANQISSTS